MRTFRKVFELSWTEVWLLGQATVLLSVVRVALKFVTISRLQRFAERLSAGSRDERKDLSPERIAWIVRVAAEKGPYYARCLEQSLVLSWLLQRRGIEACIRFGARKLDDQMEAHAWVEVDGRAVNEEHGLHENFAPFERVAASNL